MGARWQWLPASSPRSETLRASRTCVHDVTQKTSCVVRPDSKGWPDDLTIQSQHPVRFLPAHVWRTGWQTGLDESDVERVGRDYAAETGGGPRARRGAAFSRVNRGSASATAGYANRGIASARKAG